jgi:hypothetical protein
MIRIIFSRALVRPLCHRFAAIASAKSRLLSSAINGLSTMIGDQMVDVAQKCSAILERRHAGSDTP